MNASRQGFIYTDTTMEKSDESRTSRSPTKRDLAAETIEKQLRDNDVSHKKEKALLSQKIEFLSLQLKDSQEREENARKIHDTMISAFKQDNSESAQLGIKFNKLILKFTNFLQSQSLVKIAIFSINYFA